MLVDKTIQRVRSRAVHHHYQRQRDCQQMVLNPVSFLAAEPIQKQAEPEVNSGNCAYHGQRDEYGGNSAE
jgi:hypothetical protein